MHSHQRHRPHSTAAQTSWSTSIAVLFAVLLWPVALAEDAFPGRTHDGSSRLGRPAPALEVTWISPEGFSAESAAGKVRLIRWWTDTCPFCSTSSVALNQLHRQFSDRGLAVLGVFHPKPPTAPHEAIERAVEAAQRFGFQFPIAVDHDWSALRSWWLDHEPGWTSVSFLVDEQGVIRYVHPGGEYHDEGLVAGTHWQDHQSCHQEFDELRRLIEQLLSKTK